MGRMVARVGSSWFTCYRCSVVGVMASVFDDEPGRVNWTEDRLSYLEEAHPPINSVRKL